MGDHVAASRTARSGGVTDRVRAAFGGRPQAPVTPRILGDRAVVAGGSIAGTLAARVLSDWYREVVVVDRDEVLGVTGMRKGASHAVHAHGLHARGYLILSDLFPGLLDDAKELGLPVRDFGLMRWYFNARPIARTETGLLSVAGNRPVLENYLRSRVAGLPNVTYRQHTDVLGLVASGDRGGSPASVSRSARRAAPRNGSTPTWWSTPPAGGPGCPSGWPSWATNGLSRNG